MDKGGCSKLVKPVEEEVAGLTAEDEDVCNEENYNKKLVGKLWTDCPYNARAFKSTMIQAWRLKNQVEIQELQKNLYLFCFSTRKEADAILNSGPWSFDRNLVILSKISGEEQPSDLELARVSFWVRIYDLPLKLRSESMARKIGDLIGMFEEMDYKDNHRIGRFLRIKVSLDLRVPLKRGTNVKYQSRDLWIGFKYERLPNFCFICGRIGHQMKDCEEDEDKDDEEYRELEEKDQPYGPWLRASPLPKFTEEVKKESSSGTCSKSLFSPVVSSKRNPTVNNKKNGDEEVNQVVGGNGVTIGHVVAKVQSAKANLKAVEEVAETLGTVAISKQFHPGETSLAGAAVTTKKWTRKKDPSVPRKPRQPNKKKETGKRVLCEVMMVNGGEEENRSGEKKQKGDVVMIDLVDKNKEVVLDDQHHRAQ